VRTKGPSLGARDFERLLHKHDIEITKTAKLFPHYGELSLPRALESVRPYTHRGDILAIVRGGGDTQSKSFKTFNSEVSANALMKFKSETGAFIVAGIGHTDDRFLIDEYVDYAAPTPTYAAFKVAQWLGASPRV
jgi:exonuclease VII large subunit